MTEHLGGRHNLLKTQLNQTPGHDHAAVSMFGSPPCQKALPPFPPAWPCALLAAPPILVVAALACSTHGFINLCHAACTLAHVKALLCVLSTQHGCTVEINAHKLQLAVNSYVAQIRGQSVVAVLMYCDHRTDG